MTILNLTPHVINVLVGSEMVNIQPRTKKEGDKEVIFPARLSVKTVAAEPIGNIPTSVTVFGEPQDLPNEKEGTFLIVSQLIKNALPNRKDLLVPAEVIRDEKGNIVGCQSLGR